MDCKKMGGVLAQCHGNSRQIKNKKIQRIRYGRSLFLPTFRSRRSHRKVQWNLRNTWIKYPPTKRLVTTNAGEPDVLTRLLARSWKILSPTIPKLLLSRTTKKVGWWVKAESYTTPLTGKTRQFERSWSIPRLWIDEKKTLVPSCLRKPWRSRSTRVTKHLLGDGVLHKRLVK